MRTTDYTPGTLILIAGETFRYLGEFDYFGQYTLYMYDPINTKNKYNTLEFPEWHAKNNIPESAIPFNSKIYGEPIQEEDTICK